MIPETDAVRVQAAFDAYLRGGEPAMLEFAAPDIIVTQFPDQLDVRDYHGHKGLTQVMTEWIGTWDDWTIEILRVRDVGGLVFLTALQRLDWFVRIRVKKFQLGQSFTISGQYLTTLHSGVRRLT